MLETFVMYENLIDREDDFTELSEIIRDHPTINTINLQGCCGEGINGHDVLCSIMNAGRSKLKSIDLSCNNDIATGGSTFIADFLATNPILEKLLLSNNQIDDEDANLIASALKHNTNLRVLDVYCNAITDSGWEALLNAEFDSTSLNSVADSNHTCGIFAKSRFNGGQDESDDFFEPTAVRKKKIHFVLSSRNRDCSNVQHLDDVPVEFLPDMLRSIQQYSDYHTGDNVPPKQDEVVKALSVVYEIMRWWDKSVSVYELLGS